MKHKRQIKQQLLKVCFELIDVRISLIENSLKAVQESRNNETKSSAGDKYETGRAMLQIEEDNYKQQLHRALILKNQLQQLESSRVKHVVERGSLVITNQARYFISVGLGQVTLKDLTYFCISPVSPIGQKLMGQEKGFQFGFNGVDTEILEVW